MEELFETVSNDFWVSDLVKFFSKLCLLRLGIFSLAEWSACVRTTKEYNDQEILSSGLSMIHMY